MRLRRSRGTDPEAAGGAEGAGHPDDAEVPGGSEGLGVFGVPPAPPWPRAASGSVPSSESGVPAGSRTSGPGTSGPGTSGPGAPARARAAGRTRARSRHDPWRTGFFGVLVLAILAGAGWALLGSSLLVVRHEEVTGNRDLGTSAVLAAAAIRPGTPMASLNTGDAARRVEQIAQVLTATVSRSWPDTVVITVRMRTPALAVASGGQFALIDGSGVTVRLSQRRPAGMPLLTQPPAQLRGSGGVRAAVTILARLPRRLRRLIESVSAQSANAVTFVLRGGITVVWGGQGQDAAKAAELTVLMRTGAHYYDVSDPVTAVTQG
jgi:cell division protein FtsQ